MSLFAVCVQKITRIRRCSPYRSNPTISAWNTSSVGLPSFMVEASSKEEATTKVKEIIGVGADQAESFELSIEEI